MTKDRINQFGMHGALVMYGITIVLCIFNNTTLNGSDFFVPIFNIGMLVSIGFFLTYIALFRHVENKEAMVLTILMLFLILGVGKGVINIEPFVLLLMVFALRENKPTNIVKVYFYTAIGTVALICFLSSIGVMDFNTLNEERGLRHGFAFIHPNLLSFYLLTLWLCWYYLVKCSVFKFHAFSFALMIATMLMCWFYIISKLPVFCLAGLMVFIIYEQYFEKYNVPFVSQCYQFLCKYSWTSFLLILIFELCLTFFYDGNNVFFALANKALTGRVGLQHSAYLTHGFPLFGTNTQFSNFGSYTIIDGGYSLFMYTYGLVLEIVILTIVSLRLKDLIAQGEGNKIAFLVILIALTGIIENNFYRPGYMPFIVILFNIAFDKPREVDDSKIIAEVHK